ncbi:uncharacterized protein TA07205 [Theileria annulata]|uniref:Haemolysin-III related n=1 Tax=Theileria annulata TaxID=5874 RepID=Q4UAA1_THEAN|nr:uncharacterized protein TA07205 [Theileria annulata]CAI76252.1 hypothetical protein, conserved [Theileria annulata]|eukprot:XP_952876.1 hypothetical protein, conserved [Theileria annulata]
MIRECTEWLNKKFSSFESPRKKVPFLRGRVYIFNLLVILYGSCKIYGKKTHTWFKLGIYISFFCSACNTLVTAFYHNRDLSIEQRSIIKRVDYAGLQPQFYGSGESVFSVSYSFLIFSVIFQCLIYDFCGMPKWVRVIAFTCFGFMNHYLTVALYKSGEFSVLWDLIYSATLYLLGGLCYGAKFPNLIPRIFEHHEFMHLVMIIANLISMRCNIKVM